MVHSPHTSRREPPWGEVGRSSDTPIFEPSRKIPIGKGQKRAAFDRPKESERRGGNSQREATQHRCVNVTKKRLLHPLKYFLPMGEQTARGRTPAPARSLALFVFCTNGCFKSTSWKASKSESQGPGTCKKPKGLAFLCSCWKAAL